jgi:AcrR family transcriptional regulator
MDDYLDPRITRTHEHVLGVARQIMAERDGELSFPTLAIRAKVSKRTLYTHWGDIESVIVATLAPVVLADSDYDGLDSRGRMRLFFENTLSQLEGGMAIGFAAVIANSIHHDRSRDTIVSLHASISRALALHVGEFTGPQAAVLINSIVYSSMTADERDPDLMEYLIESGARMLEENAVRA